MWGRYTREEILAIGTASRQKKDAIRPQPKKLEERKECKKRAEDEKTEVRLFLLSP